MTVDVISMTQAKQICATCPVVLDCLTAGLVGRATEGIWGGFGDAQRRHIRRDLTGDGSAITRERVGQWLSAPGATRRRRSDGSAAVQVR